MRQLILVWAFALGAGMDLRSCLAASFHSCVMLGRGFHVSEPWSLTLKWRSSRELSNHVWCWAACRVDFRAWGESLRWYTLRPLAGFLPSLPASVDSVPVSVTVILERRTLLSWVTGQWGILGHVRSSSGQWEVPGGLVSELRITAGVSTCGPGGIACSPLCLIARFALKWTWEFSKGGRGTLANDIYTTLEKEVAWQGFCLRVLVFEARVLVQVVLCPEERCWLRLGWVSL